MICAKRNTSQLWRLALLCPLAALALHAQSPVPSDGETVDLYSSFDKDLYNLVIGTAPIYTAVAITFVNKLAAWLLVTVFAAAGWEAISHRSMINLDYVAKKFVIPYLFSLLILTHWVTPIPGLGMSFVGIFTNISSDLAAQAHVNALDTMNSLLLNIRDQIGPWAMITGPVNILAWCVVTTLMIFVKAVVMFVVATGVVGVGVGACIGPIFVIFYMFPPLRQKWFSWVEAMIKYSLYRVVGNLVIAVWCTFIVGFINNILHGQYDLVHIISNFIGFSSVMLAFIFGLFKIPSFVTDFNSGGSSGGHGLMGSTMAFVKGMFL